MVAMGYILSWRKVKARAILFRWTSGHRALMRLYDSIGPFRADNIVEINFNTNEIKLVKSPKVLNYCDDK